MPIAQPATQWPCIDALEQGDAAVFDLQAWSGETHLDTPTYTLDDRVRRGDGESPLVGPRGPSLGLQLVRGTPMPFPGTHGSNRGRGIHTAPP